MNITQFYNDINQTLYHISDICITCPETFTPPLCRSRHQYLRTIAAEVVTAAGVVAK